MAGAGESRRLAEDPAVVRYGAIERHCNPEAGWMMLVGGFGGSPLAH